MSIQHFGPEAVRPEPLPKPEQIASNLLLTSPEVFGSPYEPTAMVRLGKEAAAVDATWPGSFWAVSGVINEQGGVDEITMLRLDTFRHKHNMPRTPGDDLISGERLTFSPSTGVKFERRLSGIPGVKLLGANPREVAIALKGARTLNADQRTQCAEEFGGHYLYRVPVKWEFAGVTDLIKQYRAQQEAQGDQERRGGKLGRIFGRLRSE